MSAPRVRRVPTATVALLLVGVLATVAACGAGTDGGSPVGDEPVGSSVTAPGVPADPADPSSGSAAPGPAGPPGAPATDPDAPPPAVSAVSLAIPSVDVVTPLELLGLDGAGTLIPPESFERAGWYRGGPVPGDPGPAVIAGHVDSRAGPAVFFRLAELAPGDEVRVTRDDGREVAFRVTEVRRYPKSDFPTEDVYGPTPAPELRLVTCGGDFDSAARSYLDNVVAYAVLA